MKLTHEQLKRITDSVGERTGWDFSRLRVERAPVPWDYPDLVRQFLTQTDCVLDIGTGGGEIFLTLAPYFRKGIGIDIYPEMIEQAQQNKAAQRIEHVDFAVMDGHNLEFPDAQFDRVLNRQCDMDASETARVLRAGGYFVTQQVGWRNGLNIFEAFGWTPASSDDDSWRRVVGEFERLGCRIVARAEYDVRYWFCDVESLVFQLKAAPYPEPFDVEKHLQGVNRLVEEHSTSHGIETNEHRELLIVRKV